MASIVEIRNSYVDDGLAFAQAEARVARDAVLDLIAKSSLSRTTLLDTARSCNCNCKLSGERWRGK